MLLKWRWRNGCTQYTACSWAEEAGFDTISYGNLSVIEQGKAGELRQKAFWQLGKLNRRIADQEWGSVKNQAIKEKHEGAIPLGDADCPVWTPLELWACYCGLREASDASRTAPAPYPRRPLVSATPRSSPVSGAIRCVGSSTNAA